MDCIALGIGQSGGGGGGPLVNGRHTPVQFGRLAQVSASVPVAIGPCLCCQLYLDTIGSMFARCRPSEQSFCHLIKDGGKGADIMRQSICSVVVAAAAAAANAAIEAT